MSKILKNAAAGAAGAIASQAIGRVDEAIFGEADRRKQLKHQGLLEQQSHDLAFRYNQRSAEEADKRALKMLRDAPGSELQGIRNAGLSESLYYSGGAGDGGGGAGALGTSAGSAKADSPGEMAAARANMARSAKEFALMDAQRRNIEADTKSIEAETAATEGYKAEEAQARISEIAEKIENYKIDREAKTVETEINKIKKYIEDATKEYQIQGIKYQTEEVKQKINLLLEEIEAQAIDNEIKQTAKKDIIRKYNEEVKNIIADTAVKYASIQHMKTQQRVMNQQIQTMIHQRVIDWEYHAMDLENLSNVEKGLELQELGINKATRRSVASIVAGIASVAILKRPASRSVVTGFK